MKDYRLEHLCYVVDSILANGQNKMFRVIEWQTVVVDVSSVAQDVTFLLFGMQGYNTTRGVAVVHMMKR